MNCAVGTGFAARCIFFGLSILLSGTQGTSSTPAPYPYGAHFEEADHVYVARCAATKDLSKEETKFGTTIHRKTASFQRRATFKGTVEAEFIEVNYSEVEITNPVKVRELDPTTLESLTWAIAAQPIFEALKTYLVFTDGKDLISAIEVPERPRP